MRGGPDLKVGVDFVATVPADRVPGLVSDLQQILQELGLNEAVRVTQEDQ